MQDMREQYVNRMREKSKEKRKGWIKRRNIDASLQIVLLVGSVSLPVVLNISEVSKLVPTVLSIVVAVSAGMLKYFKFDEWGRIQRSTSLQLENELEDYGLETGQYKGMGKEEAFHLFRQRTLLILHEHVQLVNDLREQPQSAKPEEETDRKEPASV